MKADAIRAGAGVLLLMTAVVLIAAPTTAHAAIESRSILKSFFEKGDKPTQQQFGTLIDSVINRTDDGLVLVGMAVTPDGTPTGSFLRLGANVGINETMPGTFASFWRTAPAPNIPPIPGMCPSFCGSRGFLPLMYQNAAGEAHYGFLQLTMADDDHAVGGGMGFANGLVDPSGPAIFIEHWVWESTPGATLTTFVVPEPAAAALVAIGLAGALAMRRRK